jgi:hypothetical protein
MKKIIFLVVIVCVLLFPSLMAFAVSSQYYDANPLYMQPGETVETFFTLQNLAGDKEVTLRADVTDGKDIITLTDPADVYTVPVGEKMKVHFSVHAPTDAKKGDVIPVTIIFTTITTSNGPVQIGSSIGKGFNVIIGQRSDFVEVPAQKTNYLLIGIVTIIALLIIVFIIKKFRGRKQPVRKKR